MLCVVKHAVAGPNACMHGGDRAGQDTRVALAGTVPADRSSLMIQKLYAAAHCNTRQHCLEQVKLEHEVMRCV